MSDREIDEMKKLMNGFLAPVGDVELRRDLWPEMQARLARPAIRVPWWDWALLTGATLVAFSFPQLIPALLYHF